MMDPQYLCFNSMPTVYHILMPSPTEVFYSEYTCITLINYFYFMINWSLAHSLTPSSAELSSLDSFCTQPCISFYLIFNSFVACYSILIFKFIQLKALTQCKDSNWRSQFHKSNYVRLDVRKWCHVLELNQSETIFSTSFCISWWTLSTYSPMVCPQCTIF